MIKNKEIKTTWKPFNLVDCVDILDSKRIPINSDERERRISDKQPTALFPYYGATGQVGFIDNFLFDEELVLLGEDGAPFLDLHKTKAYLIKGKTWVNNHAHVLRAKKDITINSFLCHYLNYFDYHGYVTGTTRLKLNQSQMKVIPFFLPSLTEQKCIVAKIEELFSKLDAGVEALKRVKAEIRRYRQVVLKQAFEGKLTAKWRMKYKKQIPNGSSLLDEVENISNRYQNNKKCSLITTQAIPSISSEWVWVNFSKVVNISQNGLSKRNGEHGKPTKVLRLSDIVNDQISDINSRSIPLSEDEVQRYQLRSSDLLCIRVNGSKHLTGKMISFNRNDLWTFCDHFIRFQLIEELVSVPYVRFFFYTKIVRRYIELNMVSSAGQNTVSQPTILNIPIPLPCIKEQNVIVEEIERHFSIADEVEKQVDQSLQQSEQLRQSILKKAFEGKLVPQDPMDEPVEKLLERIKEKREIQSHSKVKKGRIKAKVKGVMV